MRNQTGHVLITADTLGGVWTYTRELVSGLARSGIHITLVSFGEIPASAQADWVDRLRRDGCEVDFRPTAFKLEWMQGADWDLAASKEFLLQVVDEVKPDLLHFNQFCYGALASDLPRIVVAHSDVVSWWVAVHGVEPPASDWIFRYRDVVARGISGATALVAPSRWMLEQIGLYYALPKRTSVIYNGRDPRLFRPSATKLDSVLSVGRLWDPGKQVRLLSEQFLPIPVHVLGSDRNPDEPDAGPQTGSGPANVRFHGSLPESDVASWFERATIYAATSRYEPFGLAPVEAALSGCAIVANDIPSFRELWGDAVLYFRANDGASLAEGIEKLWRDPGLRSRYAAASYERASHAFSARRMIAEYLDLYRSVAWPESVPASSISS